MSKKSTMVTMNAQVAVTKTEAGLEYVQVLPDNPRVGLVEPFTGYGRAQMLSNGSFDFLRRKRIRKKPELKLEHMSLSYGDDGYDRCIFTLPSGQREEFNRLFQKEGAQVMAYMCEHFTRSTKNRV